MKGKKKIENNNLDQFLNAQFLNEYSKIEHPDLAENIFNHEFNLSIDKIKEKKLLNKLQAGGYKGGVSWKVWIWFSLMVIVAIIISYLITKDENSTSLAIEPKAAPIIDQQPEIKVSRKMVSVLLVNDSTTKEFYKQDSIELATTSIDTVNYAEKPPAKRLKLVPNRTQETNMFTKEEMAYYSKLKPTMISKIIEQEEKTYLKVHEALIYYKGQKLGVDAFVLRKYAVTNMEYKVFLVDLIRNGNKNVLEICKVNDEGWKFYNYSQLATEYFHTKKYDGFPLVNINPQAALLYCMWLERETNKFLKATNPKAKPFKIRLPFDYEWISATKIGLVQTTKCEGYQTIFDLSEGLVNKAFIRRLAKTQDFHKKKRTKYDDLFDINRYGMEESEVLKIFNKVDKLEINSENLIKVFKAAIVTEFIQNKDQEIVILGNCWKSKEQYNQMLNDFKQNSASPFIGFRYVVDNDKLPSYKNPFW